MEPAFRYGDASLRCGEGYILVILDVMGWVCVFGVVAMLSSCARAWQRDWRVAGARTWVHSMRIENSSTGAASGAFMVWKPRQCWSLWSEKVQLSKLHFRSP